MRAGASLREDPVGIFIGPEHVNVNVNVNWTFSSSTRLRLLEDKCTQ